MVTLKNYINPDFILFLNGTDRNSVLSLLVDHAVAKGGLKNDPPFLEAVLQREAIVTTGIGSGVAIPHAKLASLHSFFIVVAILDEGINWKALDDLPVRIIFLIGGPDDQQTEYLQILSALTHFIKDEKIRRKLLTSKSKEEILTLFDLPSAR